MQGDPRDGPDPANPTSFPKVNVGDPAMSRELGIQSRPVPRSTREPARPVVPVLIQVPALSSRTRASVRAALRSQRRPAARRRRLRREIRMVGCTILMASPFVLASLLIWGGRPNVLLASSRPEVDAACVDGPGTSVRPPAISISIEPSAGVPFAEYEPPVVLPGYLLPDDNCEDTAHAGS